MPNEYVTSPFPMSFFLCVCRRFLYIHLINKSLLHQLGQVGFCSFSSPNGSSSLPTREHDKNPVFLHIWPLIKHTTSLASPALVQYKLSVDSSYPSVFSTWNYPMYSISKFKYFQYLSNLDFHTYKPPSMHKLKLRAF